MRATRQKHPKESVQRRGPKQKQRADQRGVLSLSHYWPPLLSAALNSVTGARFVCGNGYPKSVGVVGQSCTSLPVTSPIQLWPGERCLDTRRWHVSLRRRDLRAALLIARSPGRCQIQLPGGFLCCGCSIKHLNGAHIGMPRFILGGLADALQPLTCLALEILYGADIPQKLFCFVI